MEFGKFLNIATQPYSKDFFYRQKNANFETFMTFSLENRLFLIPIPSGFGIDDDGIGIGIGIRKTAGIPGSGIRDRDPERTLLQ